MPAHGAFLNLGQRSGFFQQLVGHPQFADIVQQAGQFKHVAPVIADLQLLAQKARQTRHAIRMLFGEGAFGVDDAGEDMHQTAQVFKRHRLSGGFAQPGGHIAIDVVTFEHEPECLGLGQLHEGINQLRAKPVTSMRQNLLADVVLAEQDVSPGIQVFQGQNVDPVHHINAVGRQLDWQRQIHRLKRLPMGMVVAHHWQARGIAPRRARIPRVPDPRQDRHHATKQLVNQHDLALAYSPGVAAPCEEIVKDPANAFKYTSRGNLVAVITNGTAVLGLGDIGPLAAKPVMEGKGVLFKKFAGIDVFDIEINEKHDLDKLVDIIASLEPTFGGINLEDIKAPDCFYVERKLRERMKIPVFHDDQHGTAIVVGAAMLNGLKVVGKDLKKVKLVTSVRAPQRWPAWACWSSWAFRARTSM
jgi:hypothetical protein